MYGVQNSTYFHGYTVVVAVTTIRRLSNQKHGHINEKKTDYSNVVRINVYVNV